MPETSRRLRIAGAVVLAIATYVSCVAFLTPSGTLASLKPAGVSRGGDVLTYDGLRGMIDRNEVSKAYWNAYEFTFVDRKGEAFKIDEPITFLLEDTFKDLRAKGVDIVFGPPEEGSAAAPGAAARLGSALAESVNVFFIVFPILLIGGVLFFLLGTAGRMNGGRWPKIVRKHSVRFEDVAGHGETRFELEEIRAFLKDPAAFEAVGARAPKGVLMVGPPGTGKTLMAKALAGECGAAFISVAGSDFSSMFVGQGRNKIRRVFETARKNAPAIVFIDEIDSVARRRGGDSSSVSQEKDLMLNQLLVQMDGFEDSGGVVVVGATNRVDVLDPAILRAGRFDRQIHVGLPDRLGREQILTLHARGKPLASDVDLARTAKGTPGFSGADLANVVNEAAILAAREQATEISGRHFEAARDKVVLGVERRSAAVDDEERRLVALHEAGHAVAACLVEHSDPVHQATIIPRGQSLGSVMRLPERDRLCVPRSRLLADLVVAMAGRAAEETFLGADHVTTGAASDIAHATDVATRMVCEWGLSPAGLVRLHARPDGSLGSEAEAEIRAVVDRAYADALRIVDENRCAVSELAAVLLDRETLTGDEVRAVVEAATGRDVPDAAQPVPAGIAVAAE